MNKKMKKLTAVILAAAIMWSLPADMWAASATGGDIEDSADSQSNTEESGCEENQAEESESKESECQESECEEREADESEMIESECGKNESEISPVFQKKEPASLDFDITDNGVLDYRTYIDGSRTPKIHISYMGAANSGCYGIVIGSTNVISMNYGESQSGKDTILWDGLDNDRADAVSNLLNGKFSAVYTTNENDLSFRVNAVGRTELCIIAMDEGGHGVLSAWGMVEVRNSSLYDEDFYIEVSRKADGSKENSSAAVIEKYRYEEWIKYLESHDNWVNGSIEIQLSEEGKKYFTSLNIERTGQTYTFWAENTDKKAATQYEDNGIRSFTAYNDADAPVLSGLTTDSKCYEPTKTDTQQYFAQDFILKGSYKDEASGVSRVEYTTDFTSEDILQNNEGWQKAPVSCEETGRFDFQIDLSDGCYEAIAVRAYDHAGNASTVTGFVNDKGEYIQVVVDKAAPVMDIRAMSGGCAYRGEGECWTNKNVLYELFSDEDGCPYAGIYEYEYAYVKIGDAVNNSDEMTDVAENWTNISAGDFAATGSFKAALEINEDRNGYYYFRAVSKSGVKTEQAVRQRILIQHEIADAKPLAITGVDASKQKNEWYNKASGVPVIHFEYPEYDMGAVSGEYDAPVTLHYRLWAQTDGKDDIPTAGNSAAIGILNSDDLVVNEYGKREFKLTQDDLGDYVLNFGYDQKTGYAQDGIYTLEYWLSDKAGNESEKLTQIYKIDTHEPTELKVTAAGSLLYADSETPIVYECFYNTDVSGSASAEYGMSGKGSLRILKAGKVGEWKDIDDEGLDDGENIHIPANTKCFLYVRAQDYAGNISEGWTRGIIVDNMAPNTASGRELIVEPEGANEHGFFNDDVKIKISVKDAPEDGSCAGLRSVKSSIGKDKTDTITDIELFSFGKALPTDEELAGASAFESVQVINAAENESNEAYVEVTATDRADNAKTSVQMLKIDVTPPEIAISFDNNNAVNGSFYNQGRTAEIHIHELNFAPEAVEVAITRNGQPIDMPVTDWMHDDSEHYASIIFAEDGNYTMEVSCTDLADNEAQKAWADNFTIDCTAPEVKVKLETARHNSMQKEDYFCSAVTAVVTVTEHNFNVDDFVFHSTPLSSGGAWIHDGDVHTLSITFDREEQYRISCSYKDMAGNDAVCDTLPKDFIIDKTAPKISIAGVADGSANAGEVTPVVTVLDANIEQTAVQISVSAGTGQLVKNAVKTAPIDGGSGVGYQYTLSDMTKKADGIYYLTVSACDMAGNETTLTYRFSLNRNGSAYDLSELRQLMDSRYHTYAGLDDFRIIEMNVDTVEEFDVYISRNGALGYKAAYTRETEGCADTGYTYIYNIKRTNFEQEGSYRLSLYSKDRAGNEINNTRDIDGDEIMFVIDNTAPKVVIDGIESGKLYDVETKQVSIIVTDNFKLSEAEFALVNEEQEVLETWNYMELSDEGEILRISIPQYKGELSLLYRVKDAAGNEMQTFRGEQDALYDFLITTDKLVQFLHKPAQTTIGRAILAFVTVSGAAAACAAALRWKKRSS